MDGVLRGEISSFYASVERYYFTAETEDGFYDWSGRNGEEVSERRDRQIVHQLEFFRELDGQ